MYCQGATLTLLLCRSTRSVIIDCTTTCPRNCRRPPSGRLHFSVFAQWASDVQYSRYTLLGLVLVLVLVLVLGLGLGLRLELHLVRVLEQPLVRIEQAVRPEWSKAGEWAALERLARAAEAVAGRSVSRPLPWESRTSPTRQTRPEQPQGPSSGTARG